MADVNLVKRNIGRMVDKGAPEADIDAYLQAEGVSLAELKSAGRELASTAGGFAADVAKSAGTGLLEGGLEMHGMSGDVRNAALSGIEYLSQKMSPEFARTVSKARPAVEGFLRDVPALAPMIRLPMTGPSSDDLKAKAKEYTGEFYEPQSTTGEFARTLGRFAPNVASPGTMARRAVGGVVAPALASEAAGQATKGGALEPYARLAAALLGGVAGSAGVSGVNAARNGIKGVPLGASGLLEKNVTPGAEARLAELGPDAYLMEGTPGTFGLAQGLVTRPGEAQDRVVNAVRGRQEGANARLSAEIDDTLGPVVGPANIENNLDAQRASLQPLYQAVTGLNVPVETRHIYDQLRMAIAEEAGSTQSALRRVQDMIAPATRGGERIPKSTPREVLNVRQALDDELIKLADQPKAHAAVTRYRVLVDRALAEAVPDIKVLDATYSNLMGESDALRRGAHVLKTGPEAIRPEDLIAERGASSLPQREAMRHGTRAEIDRLVGTKANDITALKLLVQSDGDWNRTKLAEIFGAQEAKRIFNAVDREAAFQDSYRKLVENSQTAQRQGAARMIAAETGTASNRSLRDLTLLGAVSSAGQAVTRKIGDAISGSRRVDSDKQLATILTKKGPERDELVKAIRGAQTRRKNNATTAPREMLRALGNLRAAARTDGREEK